MPCFKGLAVSIHTPEGPLPEYSIQKQSRLSRISSYIPVPPPKFKADSSKPEQSTFAISITLLQPGAGVPYSRAAPTPDDPFPSQKIVGGLPNFLGERGKYGFTVPPYVPLTSSPNETVAAYIHFDGRAKEEVATLLRRGVETWVNSRWVSVPESEGGGLAEREFLFREVGLERWLNGLDLQGESKDVAARLERRRQKLEKKRRKKLLNADSEDDDDLTNPTRSRPGENNGILRYGEDRASPVEDVSRDDGMLSSSDDDSDDDVPDSEAAGQIKVSLFRVMASGEIKKGEYSPSFDAHDDDDDGGQDNRAGGDDAGIDHTTTFAKPKTLDPKSISTQTVTGIDDPSKPYATFTFFYRGQRQLQKMGILQTKSEPSTETTSTSKRKSRQLDFSNLGELKPKGTVGFAGYRDPTAAAASSKFDKLKNGKRKDNDDDDMDSDGDDGTYSSRKQSESKDAQAPVDAQDEESKATLSPEEIAKRGELAEGVKKIHLKRQLSVEPLSSDANTNTQSSTPTAPVSSVTPSLLTESSTASIDSSATPKLTISASTLSAADPSASIGSPFKKQRGESVTAGEGRVLFGTGGVAGEEPNPIAETLAGISNRKGLGLGNLVTDDGDAMQTPLNSPIATTAIGGSAVGASADGAKGDHGFNAEDGSGMSSQGRQLGPDGTIKTEEA